MTVLRKACKSGMCKFGPWGVLWSLCLRYFPSRYDPEIWHTGQGRQMMPSEFFWGQDYFWWLQNWSSKRPCGPWVLSDWEEMGSWNFAGSFLDSIRNFIQLNRSIGCTLVSIFLGQVQKSQCFLIRLLTIFHKFQENFKRKLKWSNSVFIEFYRIWHLR